MASHSYLLVSSVSLFIFLFFKLSLTGVFLFLQDSILDIRTPLFSGGKLLGISSYMDSFPFPFYLILRDISNLPAVLSDALRQWFELVSNSA